MSLTINTNLEAMNASRNLNTDREHARCRDAASVLGSPHQLGRRRRRRLRHQPAPAGQVNGLNQAQLNSQDAVSLAQTAQGCPQRCRRRCSSASASSAVQYANGTTSETDKEAIESESNQLKEEIKRVGETTKFNGVEPAERRSENRLPGRRQRKRNDRKSKRSNSKKQSKKRSLKEIKTRRRSDRQSRRPLPVNSVRSRTASSTRRATWKSTPRTWPRRSGRSST